jgi:outer membrane receptor protein involved in Fe transport
MNTLLQKLMLGGSTAALVAAVPVAGALAQTSSGDIEQVVVSASRITIAGYQQPTPVTVVGAAQIENEAAVDIGDTIRQLPAVGASAGPSNGSGSGGLSGAGSGLDQVNLRQLGILRTLVLFDGQRVVQANITGGVDLSTIPTTLIQRIDVVTGGASAAWGSDAVAGVVNLILNKNFTGIKANVEGSDTAGDTFRTYKLEGSWGADFDAGRGHVILSAGYSGSPDTVWEGQAKWENGVILMGNPAYVAGGTQPQNIHVANVGFSNATPGGVITASPAVASTNTPANALKGLQFLGPNATPATYNFGNVSSSFCFNCSGNFYTTGAFTNALAATYHTTTLFGYSSYKITDSIKASVQVNWGQSFAESNASDLLKEGNLTIKSDNAFIPASVQSIIAADKITSFTFGTTNLNNIDPHAMSWYQARYSVGAVLAQTTRQLMRGVFTLEGTLNEDWGWNVYYQHGDNRVNLHAIANTNTANYNNAIDAVTVTAANVGTSGLAVGSIACRSTLTAPTNGCVPLDIFGVGVASPAAVNYINPPGKDVEHLYLSEDVAAGSMQGTLPWEIMAGKPAVAFGAEYRHEGGRIVADPLGATAGWASGNFTNFAGQYYIYEGFAELDAPILKDNIVESLDLNIAGRMTSYSTSGLVETWKIGLTSQVNDDIRLRTTWSSDIRAPDLAELFSGSQLNTTQGVVDPKTGIPVSVVNNKQGNNNLNPETAISITGGVVLTPHWINGLSISADWYSINIKNAIYTASSNAILQQCAAGVAIYCSQLIFQGTQYPGALSQINTAPINASSQSTSGLDVQADYAMDLFGGTMNWHAVANYTDEETQTAIGVKYDYAGSLGSDSLVQGFPKFRATLSSTYAEGPWSGTIQGRFIGSAVINNAWRGTNVVDNNAIPFVGYLDLRGSYKWNENIQLYGAINNFTDVPAPNVATLASSSGGDQNVRTIPTLYDALGRVYRAGVRVSF